MITCRNRKAQAAAAKVVEEKEEMGRRHAVEITLLRKSMSDLVKEKCGKIKRNKKRKHYTSSCEDSSSDSEASGEVCLSSHSDKKRKKTSRPKQHRRSPTPRSPTPPLTVPKGKEVSPPHALTRTGSDHSKL